MSEFCLVIPTAKLKKAGYLPKIGLKNFENYANYKKFCRFIAYNHEFQARKTGDETDVENRPELQQVVPYSILKLSDGKIFFYTRGSDGTLIEERLAGKVSAGIGGHINQVDEDSSNLIEQAAIREFTEEIIITENNGNRIMDLDKISQLFQFKPIGLLKDSDAVGQVHLGLIYWIQMSKEALDSVSISLDPKENQAFEWLDHNDFWQRLKEGSINPEGWTRILMESLYPQN